MHHIPCESLNCVKFEFLMVCFALIVRLTVGICKLCEIGVWFLGFDGLFNSYCLFILCEEGKASLLSLVKTFDSVLAAYEGFCNLKQLLDPNLINAYDYEQFEKMVFAAILCVRRAPQSCPQISLILKLLQGDPEVLEWATEQVHALEEVDSFDGEQLGTNLQSFINLALLNFEEGSASSSSTEQNILVEDYLQGRWSRSSSFD
ncbi:Protein kinase protein with adenine nucleotide alpha hydrolase-like domain [Abeliophyllum distichum]|uniref:Protein kinase protein with adenine nucleotide alpha hydrolase-like domain n=1 Tax=Abeliophyllum distichum TaxID=126358 RepID=A0ABD1P2N0_9LAMI